MSLAFIFHLISIVVIAENCAIPDKVEILILLCRAVLLVSKALRGLLTKLRATSQPLKR